MKMQVTSMPRCSNAAPGQPGSARRRSSMAAATLTGTVATTALLAQAPRLFGFTVGATWEALPAAAHQVHAQAGTHRHGRVCDRDLSRVLTPRRRFLGLHGRPSRGRAVLSSMRTVAAATDRDGKSDSAWPKVSVQVVTYKRPQWLAQALAQIAQQDYPGELEVLVVDDTPGILDEPPLHILDNLDVKHIRLSGRHYSIGEKRNLAVTEAASSDIVCIWDDDDIFTVDRIRQQVSRMVARSADCSCIALGPVVSTVDGGFQSCRGLPLPFENTFCFRRSWLLDGRSFTNCSLGEGIAVFERSSDWYAEAQPISVEELPFLYVRTAASTAPQDALGPRRNVTSLLVGERQRRLDHDMLALVKALRRGRFPQMQHGPGAHALAAVRRAVRHAVEKDLAIMRAADAECHHLAPDYWSGIGGPLTMAPRRWGPSGEAPEGSTLKEFAGGNAGSPPPSGIAADPAAAAAWATRATQQANGAFSEPEKPTVEEALRLLEEACTEL